ncbi:hypothetical protein MRB53_042255 [Persea americana]|nr:hypothetical protein MRB53_042255 [Persea americana]
MIDKDGFVRADFMDLRRVHPPESRTADIEAIVDSLTTQPIYMPNCCVSLSRPMIEALAVEICDQDLILSIGCGSGLLETLLLVMAKVNIVGVEVPSCPNIFLPSSRFIQVQSTTSVYDEAMLASVIMFVYPRSIDLIIRYLNSFIRGAWQLLVVICPRDEWEDMKARLEEWTTSIKILSGIGFANHEIVAVATVKESESAVSKAVTNVS